MNKKPSYEELEEKIKKLENSSILNSLKQDIKINEIFFKKLLTIIKIKQKFITQRLGFRIVTVWCAFLEFSLIENQVAKKLFKFPNIFFPFY